jgi:hypothetical protein
MWRLCSLEGGSQANQSAQIGSSWKTKRTKRSQENSNLAGPWKKGLQTLYHEVEFVCVCWAEIWWQHLSTRSLSLLSRLPSSSYHLLCAYNPHTHILKTSPSCSHACKWHNQPPFQAQASYSSPIGSFCFSRRASESGLVDLQVPHLNVVCSASCLPHGTSFTCLLWNPGDRRVMFLRNVGRHPLRYTLLYPKDRTFRRQSILQLSTRFAMTIYNLFSADVITQPTYTTDQNVWK